MAATITYLAIKRSCGHTSAFLEPVTCKRCVEYYKDTPCDECAEYLMQVEMHDCPDHRMLMRTPYYEEE